MSVLDRYLEIKEELREDMEKLDSGEYTEDDLAAMIENVNEIHGRDELQEEVLFSGVLSYAYEDLLWYLAGMRSGLEGLMEDMAYDYPDDLVGDGLDNEDESYDENWEIPF